MPLIFKLKAGSVPAGKNCLVNLTETLKGVQSYMTIEGPDGLTATILSETTPGVDDQDKVWIKLHANGKPEGEYVYGAAGWNRVPAFASGMIMLFSGLVADIPPGWHLANGVAPSSVNLTADATYGQMWTPAYSALETTYTLCIIEFVGLQP